VRFLLGALYLTGMLFAADVAAAQMVPRAIPHRSIGSAYARTDVLRAGISPPRTDASRMLTQTESTHRVKHAAIGAGIGAGLGLIAGAAIGAQIDHTRPATFPATPILALEGAGIGLVAGLVAGALIR